MEVCTSCNGQILIYGMVGGYLFVLAFLFVCWRREGPMDPKAFASQGSIGVLLAVELLHLAWR